MELSIIDGGPLPDTYEEFCAILAAGVAKHTRCVECGEPFAPSNTHTRMGWRETQISGACEDCFDSFFEGEEE